MRIELINLPFSTMAKKRIDPPLYLLQIAPILSKNFDIRINDLNGIDKEDWNIGHCLFYILYVDNRNYNYLTKITKKCKLINPNSKIVVCGSGASKNIKHYLTNDIVDVIIKGEGEIAIRKILNDFLYNKTGIKLYYFPVKNINTLPFPDRSYIDLNNYTRKLDNKKAVMVMGSRGSPYRSTWYSNTLKTYSVTRIINEICSINKKYGISHFYFGDESFCYDIQRALNIGRALKERNFYFSFNEFVTKLDLNIIDQLVDLGLKELVLNSYGAQGQSNSDSIKYNIEERFNIRVILRRESKYHNLKQ